MTVSIPRCPDDQHVFERSEKNNLIVCTVCDQGDCPFPLQPGTMPGEHNFRHETVDGRLACLCGLVKSADEAAAYVKDRFLRYPSLPKFAVRRG